MSRSRSALVDDSNPAHCSTASPSTREPVDIGLCSHQYTKPGTVSCSPELQLLLDHSSSKNMKEIAEIQRLSAAATHEGNVLTWAIQPKRGQEQRGEGGPAVTACKTCQSGDSYTLVLLQNGAFLQVSRPHKFQPCHKQAWMKVQSCQLAKQPAWDAVRSQGPELQQPLGTAFLRCRGGAGQVCSWNLQWLKSTEAEIRLGKDNEVY